MKLLKLLIPAIALFVVAAFGLTGCGGGGGGGSTGGTGGGGGGGGGTVTAPASPTNVVAAGGNLAVTLNWSLVDTATSYKVYYSTTTGVTTSNGTLLTPTTNTLQHTGLATGTTYYYIVVASNAGGDSPASAEAHALTTPAAPVITQATPDNGSVTVTWNANVPTATSYKVYYGTDPNVTLGPITSTTGSVTINALTNDTTYYFVVSAVNATGETRSAAVTADPSLNPAPSAPAGLAVVSNNVNAAVNPTYRLTWTTAPVGPTASPVTSYAVYYANSPGVTISNSFRQAVTPANLAAPVLSFTTLASDTYYFRVAAINADGESALSNEAVGFPPVFSDDMIAGKTIKYFDNVVTPGVTPDVSFSASATGNTITMLSSTIAGIPSTGTGTWSTLGQVLTVVINPTPTTLGFVVQFRNSSSAGVTLSVTGTTPLSLNGVVTFN
jgi:hypothetical protein